MTKEVSLKKKFCLRSVTSTIHTSHLEYMYIQVVWYGMVYGTSGISYSGCSQDVPNYTIENEQLIFLGFILHVFSLDTASMK